MVDAKYLSNHELQYELEKLGFSPGPILPSTRKIYENKLKQLMVLHPRVSPVINRYREEDRMDDCDDTEDSESNDTFILKGNIIISKENIKGSQKRLKMSSIIYRTLKPNYQDLQQLNRIRCAVKTLLRQSQDASVTDCTGSRKSDCWEVDPIPVGLQLAVFGIFIIVVFVYFTVEKKSFFA